MAIHYLLDAQGNQMTTDADELLFVADAVTGGGTQDIGPARFSDVDMFYSPSNVGPIRRFTYSAFNM